VREIALDTQAATTVAIVDNGSVIARAHNDSGRHHAESITPLVREALSAAGLPAELADAGIDRILVGTGPAPFTGLRAGIVTARALGFAWSVSVYGMMSLTALAERAYQERVFAQGGGAGEAEGAELLVASDARRREVYSARYRVNAEGYSLVDGPTVSPASEILPGEGPSYAYGYGAGLYAETLRELGWDLVEAGEGIHPHAEYLLAAAARRGLDALSLDTSALYLRDSDAKIPAAMLARQQKQAARATAQTVGQREG